MYKGNSIGVVVPAYNESGLVGEVIETLPQFVDRAYVVDDCSTDGTWAEVSAAAARVNDRQDTTAVTDGGVRNGRIVPIRHEENRGVGGAMKTGYLAAHDDGLDVVAVMGGDGQMDPDILDRIVEPVVTDQADYAKGNRLVRSGDAADMPFHRIAGNYVLTQLTRVASGYWEIGDPQNGYTAITSEAIETANAADMYEFYGYCNDILVKLNVADARVADVPMAAKYADETSHIRLSRYVPRVSGMLARNFFWRLSVKYLRRGEPSVPLCYALGTIAVALGVLGTIEALPGAGSGNVLGAAIATLIGVVFWLAAAVIDHSKNSHLNFVVTE